MRIVRYNRGFTIHASEHEMATIRAVLKHVDWEALRADLSPSQRRSMGRRMTKGFYFRTDEDKRSGEFRKMRYDGPHNDQ